MDLNAKLIILESLYCAQCANFLNPPIMLSETGKNTCGRCFREQENKNGFMQNICLEDIIKYLEVPCRYTAQGCKDKFNENHLLKHENMCNFKPTRCLITECCWSGCLKQLKEHMIADHSDYTTSSENLTFELNVNIDDQYNTQRLLLWNTELFLLNMNILEHTVKFSVCHTINNTQNNMKFIVVEVDNMKDVNWKSKNVKDVDIYNKISDGIEINVHEFKKLDSLIVNIKIKIFYCDLSKETESKYLKSLECPVCLEVMSDEIYICESGHSVCKACKRKLQKCPTCKCYIRATRNYGLESMYDVTNVACVKRSKGCAVVATGAEMKNHKQFCKFNEFSCKVIECVFSGKYNDLIDHYNNTHGSHYNQFSVKYPGKTKWVNNYYKCNVYNADGYSDDDDDDDDDIYGINKYTKHLIAYDNIFCVQFDEHKDLLFLFISSITYLQPEFQFEVNFGHKRKSIVFTAYFDKDVSRNKVIIPLDYFTDTTDINCTVRIKRK